MSDKFASGIKAGGASVSALFVLRKTTDNTEQTGKVAADMTGSYLRQGGTRTAITLSDLAAVNSAYSSGGVKEIDSTNMPGLYRLDLPDAAIATGADWVAISIKVTNCFLYLERFSLETVGAAEVYARLGAPAGASVSADIAGVQSDTDNLQTRVPTALVSGRMDSSVGAMAADVVTAAAIADNAIDAGALASNAITAAKIAADAITAAKIADGAIDAATFAAGAIDAAAIATDAIGSAEFAQAAADKVWSSAARTLTSLGASLVQEIWDRATSALTTAGSIGKLLVDNINATIGSRASAADLAIVAGYIDTEVAAIKAVTDALPNAGALTTIQADLDDIQARLPAALTGAGNIKADALAISGDVTAADNLEAAADGTGYNLGSGSIVAASVTGAVGSVTGNVGGNVVGSVASVTAGVTVTTNNDKTGYGLSAAAVQAIWDALSAALTTANSIGKRIVDFLTGDIYARVGAPAGASVSADVAAVKSDTAAVKVKTDSLTFTVAGQVDSNVLDWKSATAPAMTGDAFARLGAPAGASVSADIAAVQADLPTRITKNTALAAFPFFMVLSSDHVSAGTGLTVTATRSIDGAAFAACANAVVEIANGWYKIDLAAADLNGNTIALRLTAATADTRNMTLVTQPT